MKTRFSVQNSMELLGNMSQSFKTRFLRESLPSKKSPSIIGNYVPWFLGLNFRGNISPRVEGQNVCPDTFAGHHTPMTGNG